MQTAKKQYNYFENLESTIKVALAIYLLMFIIGMMITLLGVENVASFLQTHSIVFSVLAGVFVIGTFFVLMYVIGKINWLGDLHIKLDQRLFGFLEKTNETIFRTLISALEPHEQERFYSFSPEKKGNITQSIFSKLSDDNHLFDRLLSTGIFRNWIWYWVSIYGTFTFTLLTLSSFVGAWIQSEFFSKPLFTITWVLALAHLFVSIFIGKFLVDKTKSAVQFIVDTHQLDIANALITRIQEAQEVNDDELYQYPDIDS